MEEKEKKALTIHEKWEKDSQLPDGGINFDDSEWDGETIDIIDKRPKKS